MKLPDGEEFVLRPCVEGMCRYESLKDGTLSLCDVALLNDMLAVRDENQRRYMVAKEKKK